MKSYEFYTPSELKASGWLKRQLEIQGSGLSGNLDKVWQDVRDSAWIGGEREGWERVPYWLDGFIPLAYLLDDADMKARAKKYVDTILDHQTESGWICPCSEEEIARYDTWAVQLISKVLVVYYECSGDERIPCALYRLMKNYYDLLSSGKIRLHTWGKYRWFEAFIAINFLRKRFDEPWLCRLADILSEQGTDYSALTERWKRPSVEWTLDTHVVNLAMMLKSEAVSHEALGNEYTGLADRLYTFLTAYNGTVYGGFTGDECLSGLSPIQGTELCAIAELMYSLELLYAHTGQPRWAEILELVTFNALPATISDDMWAHQYDQMVNQIACKRIPGKSIFGTNNGEAHLFGLEPNYGCCTANFNQAWPKFALSTFMHREGEIICAVPAPAELNASNAKISLRTDYPFKNELNITVEAKEDFLFIVRVPSFVQRLTVNGEECTRRGVLRFAFKAGEEREICIKLDTSPCIIDRPHDLKAAKYGSLIFSLPICYEKRRIEYTKANVERKYPYCDYEYLPTSPWSYAYSSPFLRVQEREVSDTPFSSLNPPIVLTARVCPISWGYEEGYDSVAAKLPRSTEPIGKEAEQELYPYGCAKLRLTELPLI